MLTSLSSWLWSVITVEYFWNTLTQLKWDLRWSSHWLLVVGETICFRCTNLKTFFVVKNTDWLHKLLWSGVTSLVRRRCISSQLWKNPDARCTGLKPVRLIITVTEPSYLTFRHKPIHSAGSRLHHLRYESLHPLCVNGNSFDVCACVWDTAC